MYFETPFQYELFKTAIFVFLYTFSTYAISRAFWNFGVRGKVKKFRDFWGAVSLLIAGIISMVGGFMLSRAL